MLLVVDALADFGRSGGVDGAASSLDVTVRAAAALAEHYVRHGDRVALRVVGRRRRARRLRRRRSATCGGSSAGWPASGRRACATTRAERLQPRRHRRHGRDRALARCCPRRSARPPRRCTRRGLPVLVVDTLPDRRRRRWRRRAPTRWSPTWPGGCGAPSATQLLDRARPRSAARSWPGAARAPSTTSCTGWPAARQLPQVRVAMTSTGGLDPGQWALRLVVVARCRSSPCWRRGPPAHPPRLWLVAAGRWCSRSAAALVPESVDRRGRAGVVVVVWWAVGLDGEPCPSARWSRPRRCSAAHLAALVASYGPDALPRRRRASCGSGCCAALGVCPRPRRSVWALARGVRERARAPARAGCSVLAVGAVGDRGGRGGHAGRRRRRSDGG